MEDVEIEEKKAKIRERVLGYLKDIERRDFKLGHYLDSLYGRSILDEKVDFPLLAQNETDFKRIEKIFSEMGLNSPIEGSEHESGIEMMKSLEYVISPDKKRSGFGKFFKREDDSKDLSKYYDKVNKMYEEALNYLKFSITYRYDLMSYLGIRESDIKITDEERSEFMKEVRRNLRKGYDKEEESEELGKEPFSEASDQENLEEHDLVDEDTIDETRLKEINIEVQREIGSKSVRVGNIRSLYRKAKEVMVGMGASDDDYGPIDISVISLKNIDPDYMITRDESNWINVKGAADALHDYANRKKPY